MVGLNWDITEQLLAEQELRRHRDNLEELVNDRTEALSVAVGQARAASVAKTDFLANMSHEIRTPMNVVLGYAQMLLRDSSLNPQQTRKVEAIHSSGNHLLTLINDILEMSKIEAGRTTVVAQPFDLSGLFDQVELMFAEIAGSKGIEVVFHRDAGLARVIEGDEGKVRQVLINLLSNATKFTEKGSISIRAFYSPSGVGRCKVMITVRDTGIGIEAKDLARIFEAFDQSGAGLSKAGTGLGLAISRNFARLMNGDLTVASVLGKGSTFTFSFEAGVADTLSVPDEGTGTSPVVSRDASTLRKVLIVDDVETSRDHLSELLTEAGYEVRMAESGEEALEAADEWSPDLILMDLRMPGIGGLEATRVLRAGGSRALIIAVTASALPEVQLEAYQMGADNFLRKPFQEADLFRKMDELIDRREVDPVVFQPQSNSGDGTEPDAHELARLLAELPADLRDELRNAAIGARAGRIMQIAEEAGKYSAKAAAWIKVRAENFDYDSLLAATEPNK
jgi:signal transduction histidine kinase/DNA-binding NarL/FixJ family response regulator